MLITDVAGVWSVCDDTSKTVTVAKLGLHGTSGRPGPRLVVL